MDYRFLVSQGSIPLSASIMYYRPLEDHRFPLIEFHTSSCKSQGSLAPSLTTESRLSPGDDFLGIYLGVPTRAHTLTWVHQGRGRRGGIFGAGPLFQPLLLAQVTVPPWIVQADFTIYSAVRESTSEGEKVWQIFRPKENFGRHTIHLPGHLDYHLIWRLYWSFSTFTMLVGFGKRQIRPHEGTWAIIWKDGPNFPKSAALQTTFYC